MIIHSLCLGRDVDLCGVSDEEIEAICRDLEDNPYVAPGVRKACEAMLRREMGGMPSSFGEDECRSQFEGWND